MKSIATLVLAIVMAVAMPVIGSAQTTAIPEICRSCVLR